jgi:septal ring factor EnvC (AmiA/AmiB activator)
MQDLLPQLTNFALTLLAFLTVPLLTLAWGLVEARRRLIQDRQDLAQHRIQQHDRIMAQVRDNEATRQASFDATMADMMKTHAEIEAIRAEVEATRADAAAIRAQARRQLDRARRLQAEYLHMMAELDPQRAAEIEAIKALFDDAPSADTPSASNAPTNDDAPADNTDDKGAA